MTRAAQPTFLAALHADRALQEALTQPEILDVAVRIARAAGFEVFGADLMAPPQEPSLQNQEEGPAAEPLQIDFDGDGVPDAVLQGGRWVLLDSED